MSRLRYPFTEILARCRLCGAIGFTAASEHALGGRLIDWRREHARVCAEWPRWAERKGLRLDENGALLYPKEDGPYEPRVRPKVAERDEEDADEAADTTAVEAEPAPRATAVRTTTAPAPPPAPPPPPPAPKVDLMSVPADALQQTSLFGSGPS